MVAASWADTAFFCPVAITSAAAQWKVPIRDLSPAAITVPFTSMMFTFTCKTDMVMSTMDWAMAELSMGVPP